MQLRRRVLGKVERLEESTDYKQKSTRIQTGMH